MATRQLDALAPPVYRAALAFIERCNVVGLHVLIYCTMRDDAEQATLYARGRTEPGAIVTNARPGQSLHNPQRDGRAWAFDAVPMLAGKPLWADEGALMLMGAAGERAGLEWAGRWRGKLRERVHFQIKPPADVRRA